MKFSTKIINPLMMTDFYKWSHILQYPPKTEMVYSTWTPRSSKHAGGQPYVIVFGVQATIIKLKELWFEGFFNRSLNIVLAEFDEIHQKSLMCPAPVEWITTIKDLHALGFLPLSIKALPEGTHCPIRTPYLTITNTDPRFAWLVNFCETMLSSELWHPATSATFAHFNRKCIDEWAVKTGIKPEDMNFTEHDFSMRGMSGLEAGAASGAAHLLSSWGTDTISAIPYIEAFYDGKLGDDYIAGSVPASEHSCMCAWGKANELDLFDFLVSERFPAGFISIVSDTWDLWSVIKNILPALKDKILARDGRVVIRPDSGVPEDIICGDPNSDDPYIRKGVVECLWDIFGGTTNELGYRTLDTHIGAIYGDAINYKNAPVIFERLAAKGFAANNIVFGFGSFTYQFVTRDTFGFALKSTAVVVDGEFRQIFKDPKTDSGMKKSQKGLLVVNPDLTYTDELDLEAYLSSYSELRYVFLDGDILNFENFKTIRERANQ